MRPSFARTLLSFIAVALTVCQGSAGPEASAYKPILPAEVYAELTKRSIARIEAAAKSDAKDAAERMEAEAAVLIGYTMSAKKPDDADVTKLRSAAVAAVKLARAGDAKKLPSFDKLINHVKPSGADLVKPKDFLRELQWVMELYRGKAKGGEGLHTDLHFQPKLKNLNGTEAFLGAIAKKKLADEDLDKIARELPNFSYRNAVIASITHEFAPEKNAKEWRDLSIQMRDASIALAEAGQKKDANGVFKAAQALEATCTHCHREFKKN